MWRAKIIINLLFLNKNNTDQDTESVLGVSTPEKKSAINAANSTVVLLHLKRRQRICTGLEERQA